MAMAVSGSSPRCSSLPPTAAATTWRTAPSWLAPPTSTTSSTSSALSAALSNTSPMGAAAQKRASLPDGDAAGGVALLCVQDEV